MVEEEGKKDIQQRQRGTQCKDKMFINRQLKKTGAKKTVGGIKKLELKGTVEIMACKESGKVIISEDVMKETCVLCQYLIRAEYTG